MLLGSLRNKRVGRNKTAQAQRRVGVSGKSGQYAGNAGSVMSPVFL